MASEYRHSNCLGMMVIVMLLLLFPAAAQGIESVQKGPPQEFDGLLLARRSGHSDMKMCCDDNRQRGGRHSKGSNESDSASDSRRDRDRMGSNRKEEKTRERHEKFHERHEKHHKGIGWWKRRLAHRALGGVLMGGFIEQQQKDWTETAKTYNYRPEEGLVVKVEYVRVEPEMIEPGKPSKLILGYSVLSPKSDQSITVEENRSILSGEELLKRIGPRIVQRTAGTFATEQEVTFPKDLPEGLYALKGEVEADGKTSSGESLFRVARIPTKSGYAYALSEY
jgi:hypothetical protein